LFNECQVMPKSGSYNKDRKSRRRPRVLLIAEACNPDWASVPMEGYNLYRALDERVDLTLVTQIRNRQAIIKHIESTDRIAFIDSERLAAPFYRIGQLLTLGRGLGWTTKQAVGWLPYLYFESLAYQRFRRAIESGAYDLIHRLTPITPTYPSPIASWTRLPFVLGPLNGGLPWPKGTKYIQFAEMEWFFCMRELFRLLPYVRNTYQRASCVITGSRYTLSMLPRDAKRRSAYIPENAVDPERFHADGRQEPSQIEPFRIIYVGRLVPLKGVDLLLQAVAQSQCLGQSIITIIGDGPSKHDDQQLANGLGIGNRVEWAGRLNQDQVAERLRASSIFVLPSLKEFGGAVVVEAMACGTPCIVIDYGGPAEHVTDQTGVRIPLGSRLSLIASFRSALESLFADREKLDAMSHAGIDRVRTLYTWSAKADQICQVYEGVLRAFTDDSRHPPV